MTREKSPKYESMSLEELKANMEKSRKRMMGGRVIEANTDFYRYPICYLPSASALNYENRLRIACNLQSNKI